MRHCSIPIKTTAIPHHQPLTLCEKTGQNIACIVTAPVLQEYTLIKLGLVTTPDSLKMLTDADDDSTRAASTPSAPIPSFFLLAATLRPETMPGQTNVWVLPHDAKVKLYALNP
jgi:hypothetical protein